jgi:hypothetical protein
MDDNCRRVLDLVGNLDADGNVSPESVRNLVAAFADVGPPGRRALRCIQRIPCTLADVRAFLDAKLVDVGTWDKVVAELQPEVVITNVFKAFSIASFSEKLK